MIFFVFLPFALCFGVLKACSSERFQEIFFDDIQKDIQHGRIDLAIAKAKQAPVYDQQLCSQSKFCKYRTRLIQHLVTISDEKSFDDSLAELPLFESTESAVQDWELFLKAKGEFLIEVFESGEDLIQVCPAFFLKNYYEEGVCDRRTHDRLFLNPYQRDILHGRPDLAIKRVTNMEVPEYLNCTNIIAQFQLRLIGNLKKLEVGESSTKESLINPLFDNVDEAVVAWEDFIDIRMKAKTKPMYDKYMERVLEEVSMEVQGLELKHQSKECAEFLCDKYKKKVESYIKKKRIAEMIIRNCPSWFTKKYQPLKDSEEFKTTYGLHIRGSPDYYEGDGELISVYDNFKTFHGTNVTSVACDPEFGLARGSKYEQRSPQEFLAPFMLLSDESSAPSFHILNGQQFSSVQAMWALRDPMIVKLDKEIVQFSGRIEKPPQGLIINCSFTEKASPEFARRRLARYKFVAFCLMNDQAIVFAAGNESKDLTSLSELDLPIKSFANVDGREKFSLLNVVALDEDALNISFSSQPGSDRALASLTVCAPGANVEVRNSDGSKRRAKGTSYAAPFVSAMIAIIRSNLIMPVNHLICQSIQKTATPIVMRRSRKRLFDIPVALVDVTAGNLEAGKTYHYIPFEKTEPKPIYVDQVMIDEGRKRYGMGRVHLERALNMAIEMHGGKRKIKQVQP